MKTINRKIEEYKSKFCTRVRDSSEGMERDFLIYDFPEISFSHQPVNEVYKYTSIIINNIINGQ